MISLLGKVNGKPRLPVFRTNKGTTHPHKIAKNKNKKKRESLGETLIDKPKAGNRMKQAWRCIKFVPAKREIVVCLTLVSLGKSI
jgi:hypothetical protein